MVALFNPTNNTMTMSAKFDEIPQLDADASYTSTNVWTGKTSGCKRNRVNVRVASQDTAVFLFEPCN
jgi:hypothetical protein